MDVQPRAHQPIARGPGWYGSRGERLVADLFERRSR